MSSLDDRLDALAAQFAPLPGVLVAFSGGVDSGVVLAAAVRALGADRVVAATAVSPSLPAAERGAAAEFAASLGVRHELPRTDELSREGYRRQRRRPLRLLQDRAGRRPHPAGRPARHRRRRHRHQRRRPAGRFPARHPRPPPSAARGRRWPGPGMTKDDVRAAARRWGLPLADKPAAACLASRIAYGVPVSAEGLARVERAEAGLRAALDAAGLPVRDLRVRDLGRGHARGWRSTPRVVADVDARPELLAAVRRLRPSSRSTRAASGRAR